MVSDRESLDLGSYGDDLAGTFVADDAGERYRQRAVLEGDIRVTDAARTHAHTNFARSRAREFEVVTHFQFLMKSGEQRSSHENLLLLERVSP